MNSFVYVISNFDINRHRDAYPEFRPRSFKTGLKRSSCRTHPSAERVSRAVLGHIEEEGR
jgi:hypothetical protein